MSEIKLTQFSHGAGCGCKIAPAVLDSILKSEFIAENDPKLLVGHDKKDDAAVYDIGNGRAIISTTDFFMPIVDDPFDFGRIASVNALSDVYAMGGKPLLAIAILAWPLDKIPADIAAKVLDGARSVCAEAGILLAGGHTIDNAEPIFGLAVTGEVEISNLKRNSSATEGCSLFLTKPLGVGLLTTAWKLGKISAEELQPAIDTMLQLNKSGEIFGKLAYVKAMTDVTGFGLLGHLGEMIDGSDLSAEISFSKIAALPGLKKLIENNCMPGATTRNWSGYYKGIEGIEVESLGVLCDPQTSGGLLIAVEPGFEKDFQTVAQSIGLHLVSFGKLVKKSDDRITIKE
ncbi:MAG: selenide, water dikinase SelD [Bacteroidota bacterium]|nr:selenide, water dikinase SelD [Bacteroidota bacterium]